MRSSRSRRRRAGREAPLRRGRRPIRLHTPRSTGCSKKGGAEAGRRSQAREERVAVSHSPSNTDGHAPRYSARTPQEAEYGEEPPLDDAECNTTVPDREQKDTHPATNALRYSSSSGTPMTRSVKPALLPLDPIPLSTIATTTSVREGLNFSATGSRTSGAPGTVNGPIRANAAASTTNPPPWTPLQTRELPGKRSTSQPIGIEVRT